MKKILLLIALSSCKDQPESALVDVYGAKAPVFCIKDTPKYGHMFACRDSLNSFWICDKDEKCMAVSYPAEVFAIPVPKPAEVVP